MKYEIKEELERIFDLYESGKIPLNEVYDEVEYFYDETFPKGCPKYDENDPRFIHVEILVFLQYYHWIFPEDVKFARLCLKESLSDSIGTKKKWDDYWSSDERADEVHRYKEGVEKGYWEDVFGRFK